jgi:hypothetical protein
MQTEASGSQASGGVRLQRALVLELLGEDAQRGRAMAPLAEALGACADELAVAIEVLRDAGVVCVDGDRARASAAVRRLDELDLIAI